MLRIIFLTVLVLTMTPAAFAGKVELTTYYPAPYGEYQELNAAEVRLRPTDSPNSCVSGREGALYYDLSERAMKQCANDGAGNLGWYTMLVDVPAILLGTGTYQAFAMPAAVKTLQTLTISSVSGNYVKQWQTGIEVDTSSFPTGFYEIEWSYDVDVTSNVETSKGVTISLVSQSPGSTTWPSIDSVFLQDDEIDGAIATNHKGSRTLQVSYSRRTYMLYRITAKKSGLEPTVKGKVNSAFLKVTKM